MSQVDWSEPPRAGGVEWRDPGSVVPPPDDGWEWAIVEVMGHRRHVGRCREVERFGAKMLRIDIPIAGDIANGWQTYHYAGSALFSYTLTDEATAMKANKPVQEPAYYRLGYSRTPVDDLGQEDFDYSDLDVRSNAALLVIDALREWFPERFKAGEEITPERIELLARDMPLKVDGQTPYDAGPGRG